MSTTAQSQDFNASVKVENENAITLSVELTDQIRAFSLEQAREETAKALALLKAGVETHEQAASVAQALREASKNAEVVYTLTLGPDWKERVGE